MGQQREGREWVVLAEEFVDENGYYDEGAFRSAVQDELARLENMGHRLGRGFVVTPLRRERYVENVRMFETIGWAFSEKYMPAVKSVPEVVSEPEPIAEPEPVGA